MAVYRDSSGESYLNITARNLSFIFERKKTIDEDSVPRSLSTRGQASEAIDGFHRAIRRVEEEEEEEEAHMEIMELTRKENKKNKKEEESLSNCEEEKEKGINSQPSEVINFPLDVNGNRKVRTITARFRSID